MVRKTRGLSHIYCKNGYDLMPKDRWGLGIKDIDIVSSALGAKGVWQLITKEGL